MAQQIINAGLAANDGTNDILRGHFGKADANFTELYAGVAAAHADATRALTFRGVLVKLSSQQNGANYSSTPAVPFDTKVYDTVGFSLSSGLLTIPAGVNWVLPFGRAAVGMHSANTAITAEFYKNGTQLDPRAHNAEYTGSGSPTIVVPGYPVSVSAGNTMSLRLNTTDTDVSVFTASFFGLTVLG